MVNYVVNAKNYKPDPTLNFDKGFSKMDLTWVVTDKTCPVTQCSVGYTQKIPGGQHRLHLHKKADELIIMLKGKAIERVGSEDYELNEGDICFIPRNVPHSQTCIESVETYCIYVGAPNFKETEYVLLD
jgi:quercetin dioxygenase-like cupin family protein